MWEEKLSFANQEISANRLKWRSSRPEVFALWHGCSPVNLLHITRTPFPKNTSVRLLLKMPRKKISKTICIELIEIKMYKNEYFIHNQIPIISKELLFKLSMNFSLSTKYDK